MNEAERKLVTALRSGLYKQTASYLRLGDTYCCMGVACDVLGGDINWKQAAYSMRGLYFYEHENDKYFLPVTIASKLGWYCQAPIDVIDRNGDKLSLYALNDSGFTFDQIADVIEAGFVIPAAEWAIPA